MNHQQILARIGLPKDEARVYLSLLESGPCTISRLSRATGIHRPKLYAILPDMEQKGVVTVSPKGKQRLYVAESPEKLHRLVNEFVDEFKKALPELKSTFETRAKRPLIKYMVGKQGMSYVMDDIVRTLKRDETFYRYTSPKSFDALQQYMPKEYRKVRDQKRLQRFVITNSATAQRMKPKLDRAVKVVPPKFGLFDYEISELIYRNKVAFMDYHSETAFVVENPAIAEFQKKVFQMLYYLLPENDR